MYEDLKEEITALIAPAVEANDAEIIDFDIFRRSKTLLIKLTVDKQEGNINIDECASINKELSEKLEELQLVDGEYEIEVSSPGIDRPLKTVKDFKRVIGRMVRFHLSEHVKNKLEYSGEVENVDDENVSVRTKTDVISLPLIKITKAVQII